MKKIVKYIFLTAIKDWLFLGLLTAILGIFAVSSLLGYTALVEESTMQMVVFAGIVRIVLVFGIVIFICYYLNKSFENREISFILSKNISREKFVLSYFLGFNLITQLLLIPIVLILIIFNNPNVYGLLQWFFSISFELIIITTFSIAVSFIVKSFVFSVFSCTAFYIISRMMNFFVDIMVFDGDNKLLSNFMYVNKKILSIICNILPRLDLFSQTKWLVYGADCKTFFIITLQTVIYSSILFFVALYDFRKKQF